MASTILWMSLLFVVLLASALASLGVQSSPIGYIIVGVFIGGTAYIYSGFRRRAPWALGSTKVLWVLLMAMCAIVGLLDVVAALNGNLLSGLLALMLFYVCYTMGGRFPNFSNPLFVAWYLGSATGPESTLELRNTEVMAACPNCMSILAVKPLEMSAEEQCPNCGGRLVSESTATKFAEEE